jgi:hypothetical protein
MLNDRRGKENPRKRKKKRKREGEKEIWEMQTRTFNVEGISKMGMEWRT